MILVDMMPDMKTLMDRQKLVGWIVRDQIVRLGIPFQEAARRWDMPRPTLNRLMSAGNSRGYTYAIAERNLGLPDRLLSYVADGDTTAIRSLTGLDETLRTYILRELGETVSDNPKTRRKRA